MSLTGHEIRMEALEHLGDQSANTAGMIVMGPIEDPEEAQKGRDRAISDHRLVATGLEAYESLRGQLIKTPPDGWLVFGTHAGHGDDDVKLEFWGTDEDGLPFLEREVQ